VNILVRDACKNDSSDLTKVAFEAKKYWNYPEEYIERWKHELTITDSYINSNIVRISETETEIVGFYSIVHTLVDQMFGEVFVEKGYWLDHMFILPEYHKKGIGSLFIEEIKELIPKKYKQNELNIFVDPNAEGFYVKMGAKFVRTSKSSIPDRTIPIYCFKFN